MAELDVPDIIKKVRERDKEKEILERHRKLLERHKQALLPEGIKARFVGPTLTPTASAQLPSPEAKFGLPAGYVDDLWLKRGHPGSSDPVQGWSYGQARRSLPATPGQPGLKDTNWVLSDIDKELAILRGEAEREQEPRMGRPSGHEPQSAKDQALIDEREKRRQQKLEEWLERGNDEEVRRSQMEYLGRERGKKQGLQSIIEGLGQIYPSVAADYLLTGGPPEAEPVIAEGVREDIGRIDEQIAGDQVRKAFKAAGIEIPEGIPASVLWKTYQTIARWGKESAARERKDQDLYYKLSDDFRSWNKDIFKRIDEVESIKVGLSTNDLGAKMSAYGMVKLAGDSGKLSDTDIRQMRTIMRYGGSIQLFKQWIFGEPDAEWLAKANQIVDAYERVLKGKLDKAAKGEVKRLRSAYPDLDEQRLMNTLLSPSEQGAAGPDTSGWVKVKNVGTGDIELMHPDDVKEAIASKEYTRA